MKNIRLFSVFLVLEVRKVYIAPLLIAMRVVPHSFITEEHTSKNLNSK